MKDLLLLFIKVFVIGLAVSLVYVLTIHFTGPLSLSMDSVQTTKDTLFQADGTGSVTLAPDNAEIMVGVTKTAATVASAQNQVNTSTQAILSALKQTGVTDQEVTTTDYSIYPNNQNNEIAQPFPGGNNATTFTATQALDIKVPIALASKVIDMATTNGANITGQVQFILSDSLQKQTMAKARAIAVSDAKQKAQDLASATGIRLGKIVDVQEDSTPGIIQPLMGGGVMAKANSAPTVLPAGQTTVTSHITISYETY